ncbi:MAG: transposase [Nitrospira sp.]|nr:transposase [Nitrospira sp.]
MEIEEKIQLAGFEVLEQAEGGVWRGKGARGEKKLQHVDQKVANGCMLSRTGKPKKEIPVYNKRGTAEQWIKEGKQAVKMTRLSCHRFRSNEVRLMLSLIAYNLGNLWRRLGLPEEDRELVADQFAAAAGEDRRQTGQARPLLLADVG